MRIVVDTSVWSLGLRRGRRRNLSRPQRAIAFLLRDLIVNGDAILLGVVRQELLTGIASPETFEAIRHHLRGFDDEPPDVDDYERAAAFGNACARSGVAATTPDMLICAVAAGRDLPILTTDDDFDRYAQRLPIRLYPHP
jgi:predicted nucleic acid-binding protein